MRRTLRFLRKEGFRHSFTFKTPEEVDAATVERTPLWNNRRNEHGPFDIIGDVHGCFDELAELLTELGYRMEDRSDQLWPSAGPSDQQMTNWSNTDSPTQT